MIDIASETLITLAQASERLPGRPSLCAIWRWRTKGIRGRKLECVVIGGRPYTSIEALARFAQHQGDDDAPNIRSPKARARAIAKAEAELSDARIHSQGSRREPLSLKTGRRGAADDTQINP